MVSPNSRSGSRSVDRDSGHVYPMYPMYPLFPCSDFVSQMFFSHFMLFPTFLENKILVILFHFLAPPAERQRSFSNADSSVVRRRPSVRRPSSTFQLKAIKSLISQKLSDNFFSFLACSFLWIVPMHSKKYGFG